jgi:hypothetical protein
MIRGTAFVLALLLATASARHAFKREQVLEAARGAPLPPPGPPIVGGDSGTPKLVEEELIFEEQIVQLQSEIQGEDSVGLPNPLVEATPEPEPLYGSAVGDPLYFTPEQANITPAPMRESPALRLVEVYKAQFEGHSELVDLTEYLSEVFVDHDRQVADLLAQIEDARAALLNIQNLNEIQTGLNGQLEATINELSAQVDAYEEEDDEDDNDDDDEDDDGLYNPGTDLLGLEHRERPGNNSRHDVGRDDCTSR